MKVIIVGCGKIGSTIATVLSAKKGFHVTIIDNDPAAIENSTRFIDVARIIGNGANEKTLIDAGAKDTDLIICTTDADELNILCCIMAERLGTRHSAARVRNPEYMLEYNKLWKELGIDIIINPERQTASEISRLLRYPSADCVDTFVGGRVELITFKVSEAADHFVNKSISEVFDKKIGVLLAVVERNDEVIIPHGGFVFEENDTIKILGRPSQIMNFFTIFTKRPKSQDILVIGGGKITYYLVELLKHHTTKSNIRIIEKDKSRGDALDVKLKEAELDSRCIILHGDGTDENMLVDSGIADCDSFVCLTDRDEENVIISLYAAQAGVRKIITKVNHINKNIIANLGLKSVVTPHELTSDGIVRYVDGLPGVTDKNVLSIHNLSDNGDAMALEFLVAKKAKCLDIPIRNLKIKKGILIGCIVRGNEIVIPSGDTQIHIGDSVIIIAKNNEIVDLDDILG